MRKLSGYIICLIALMACSENNTPDSDTPQIETTPATPAAPLLGYNPLNLETYIQNRDGKFIFLIKQSPKFIDRLGLEGYCHVRIDFTSYSSGIPKRHYRAARTWLEKANDVESIYAVPWGFEGEATLCAIVPNETKRQSVVRRLNWTVRKTGFVSNGSYRKARIMSAHPTPIPEANILQSPKFQIIEQAQSQAIIKSQCHMIAPVRDYFAPLNTQRSVFMREWLIGREDVTHIHGIERGQNSAYLCAAGPTTTETRVALMRDFKKALIEEFPKSKHITNIYIQKPFQKGNDSDIFWTCKLLKKKPKGRFKCQK